MKHHHGHHPSPKPSGSSDPVSAGQEASHSAHDEHMGHHTEDFLQRFWVCLVLTLPVLLLSEMIQHWFGFHLNFPGRGYALLGMSLIIFLYGGKPFLQGMVREVRTSHPGMMTLIGVAITVAFLYSTAVVFGLKGMDFFWELATLIDIMLLGHYFEMRSQMAASRALESLVALLPAQVNVLRNGSFTDIPLSELKKGDTILIKPGEKIPADGKILEGRTSINESMLTGESLPVTKQTSDPVIGGSINGDGSIRVMVTGTGKESYLQKVINMIQGAQASKSKTQNLANRVAKWLTYISLLVGTGTFIYWYSVVQDLAFALERMVTVMVTSCPHALGVAIPLVVAISTSQAAIHGLLIRNRTAFENSRNLSLIIFDKTGTLTEGAHQVKSVISLDPDYTEDDILRFAGALQQNSEHYIAKGVLNTLHDRNLELWPSEDFSYIPGIGVRGTVKGRAIVAAGPNYFNGKDLQMPTIPPQIDQKQETVNFLMID
ncbi:MAG TPA: HAD-IC family P-type ATPase, partial [Sphingobacteriaceae bacterium]